MRIRLESMEHHIVCVLWQVHLPALSYSDFHEAFFELIVHGFNGEAKIEKACHSERNVGFIKFLPNPSYCQQLHLHRSAVKMTSVSETTRTLRYELQSRKIYIEEPITSPEILSEQPQMQDESINTIQEMPNSQFRLVLSVTPCMPRTSSLESVNDSISPLLFSSTSSLTFAPTPDSPKDQLSPSPTSSIDSLTSFHM